MSSVNEIVMVQETIVSTRDVLWEIWNNQDFSYRKTMRMVENDLRKTVTALPNYVVQSQILDDFMFSVLGVRVDDLGRGRLKKVWLKERVNALYKLNPFSGDSVGGNIVASVSAVIVLASVVAFFIIAF